MKRVYIAGPYSNEDENIVETNVKKAMDMANDLIEAGFAPFCPHLTHFLHKNQPQPYEKWLEIDFIFLESCDALIRLEGKSPGADKEVKLAEYLGIKVYYQLDHLIEAEQKALEVS